MIKKKQQFVSSLILCVASISGYFYCLNKDITGNTSISPFFLPKIMLVIIFVLSACRLAFSLKSVSKDEEEKKVRVPLISLLTMALIVCYALSFKLLGFAISSSIYLFLQMLLLTHGKKRNWYLIIGISVVASFGLYLLFVNVFNVMLPPGPLSF